MTTVKLPNSPLVVSYKVFLFDWGGQVVITAVIILIVIFLTSARLDSKNLLDQKCCFDKNASWCTKQTHSAHDYTVLSFVVSTTMG